jgi:hypothetical protein
MNNDYIDNAYLPFISNELASNVFDVYDDTYNQSGVEYKINNFGYRGENFTKNVDLLSLGCSQTFGFGIPHEYTWTQLLKSDKIKTINSIASPGDSAQGQVIKFFQYVKKFGNPKNVVGVFPCYRVEFPLDKDKWEISNAEKKFSIVHNNKASITLKNYGDEGFQKYYKAPYDPNHLLTEQVTRYYTHTFINILEIYCKNLNINFKYTIYEHNYNGKNNPLKEYMLNHSNNYFEVDYPIPRLYMQEEELNFKCHSEYSDNKYFYRANDYIPNKKSGHWGLHKNLHISETVSKLLV